MTITVDHIKFVTKVIVGISVSATVGSIIGNNTTITKPHHKAEMVIAAAVLGAIAGEYAGEYIEHQIEQIAMSIEKMKAKKNAAA